MKGRAFCVVVSVALAGAACAAGGDDGHSRAEDYVRSVQEPLLDAVAEIGRIAAQEGPADLDRLADRGEQLRAVNEEHEQLIVDAESSPDQLSELARELREEVTELAAVLREIAPDDLATKAQQHELLVRAGEVQTLLDRALWLFEHGDRAREPAEP